MSRATRQILGIATTFTAVLAIVPSATGEGARLPLRSCVVQGVSARCGTLAVPEDRSRPGGRQVRLRVVVLPSRARTPARDAFTYIAGGPGGASATDATAAVAGIWDAIRARRDIVLVDQRGTGGSRLLECPLPRGPVDTVAARHAYVEECLAGADADVAQYGTVQAADDLDAVRKALGYRRLDVYGASYGATAAQVYLNRYRASVRTVVLDGGTLIDIPFYARFAQNGAAALEQVRRRCAAERACAKAFPRWTADLASLIRRWNASPVRVTSTVTLGGDGLAGVVQTMTLDAAAAASIPLAVTRAAAGDYRTLARYVRGEGPSRLLMFWTIMCNEPWVGLDVRGPWGTYLDGSTEAALAGFAEVCPLLPRAPQSAADWRRPSGATPVLALVGGADPQDPVQNLEGLSQSLPHSRIVVVPSQGHTVGQYGCLGRLVARFVERGTTAGLDARCARAIPVPRFVLR